MDGIRKLIQKLSLSVSRFMTGRYGMDKLNSTLMWTGVAVVFLALLMPWAPVRLGLTLLSYGIMGYTLFRCFSRQTYKRYQENRRFLRLLEQVKDRDHRYYHCPRCHERLRVPRGKGKISITCPKCKEKFIKKT